MFRQLKEFFTINWRLDFLMPDFCVMAYDTCLRTKLNCGGFNDQLAGIADVEGFTPPQPGGPVCKTEYGTFFYNDTNYPPIANYSGCDSSSYPVTLSAKFVTPGPSRLPFLPHKDCEGATISYTTPHYEIQ